MPFITGEIAFRQDVGKMVLSINKFALVLWIHVDVKRDSLGMGHVSHCRTSAFDNHLAYRFMIFKNVVRCAEVTLVNLRSSRLGCFFVLVLDRFLIVRCSTGFPGCLVDS